MIARSLAYAEFHRRIFQEAAIIRRIQEGISEWVAEERRLETERMEREEKAEEAERQALREAGQQLPSKEAKKGVPLEHPQRHLIPALVARLQHHNLYSDIFESFYLKKTNEFYVEEAKNLRSKLSATDFIIRCEERQEEEMARAEATMPEESINRVILELNRSFLNGHLDWIATQGTSKYSMRVYDNSLVMLALPALMPGTGPQIERLRNIYRVYSQVEGLKVLLAAFKLAVKVCHRLHKFPG